MKHLTIIIPTRIPDHIDIQAEDNVTLQTILDRYESWGNVILLNGLYKPLTTVVGNNDMIFIIQNRQADAVKSAP